MKTDILDIDLKIKQHQEKIDKINELLDSKKTSDFKNENKALIWYQKMCSDRQTQQDRIKQLEIFKNSYAHTKKHN